MTPAARAQLWHRTAGCRVQVSPRQETPSTDDERRGTAPHIPPWVSGVTTPSQAPILSRSQGAGSVAGSAPRAVAPLTVPIFERENAR
jgi:hypothetical protein